MKFRSHYDLGERLPGIYFDEFTLTQQHFKDEADINNIIAKFNRTGFLVDPLTSVTRQPMFGEFDNIPDFRETQNMIAMAKENFMELPSELRKRFHNDAVELLEFLQDENNKDEAIRLGLVNAPIVDKVVNKESEVKE